MDVRRTSLKHGSELPSAYRDKGAAMTALHSLLRRCAPRGASIAAFATATMLVAAPALADNYEHIDPARDMHFQRELVVGTRLDPTHRNGDIRRVVVRHHQDAVTIWTQFRDLHPAYGTSGGVGIMGEIKVNPHAASYPWIPGSHYTYSLEVTNTEPLELKTEIQSSLEDDPDVLCSGAEDGVVGRVDFTANTMWLRIPRNCLHRPRWVRASMDSFAKPARPFSWWDTWINPWPETRFSPPIYRG